MYSSIYIPHSSAYFEYSTDYWYCCTSFSVPIDNASSISTWKPPDHRTNSPSSEGTPPLSSEGEDPFTVSIEFTVPCSS